MRNGFKVFDADAHVVYPSDLWSPRYLEKKYAERIDRVAPAGLDTYNPVRVDGRYSQHTTTLYGQFQKSIDWTYDDMVRQYGELATDGFTGERVARALAAEGIDLCMVFGPEWDLWLEGMDPELQAAMTRAYNRWGQEMRESSGGRVLVAGPVRITVSSGQELRPVPDLTRLDGEQAVQLLGASGFLVHVDTVESSVAAGRVLAMDPAPGTEVALPATVRLELSEGPATFPMPDLAGWPEGDAVALLLASGLLRGNVDRRFSLLNVGRVFGQSPAPGEMVIAGTRVRLIVGRRIPWR